jgi:hypothetical protein
MGSDGTYFDDRYPERGVVMPFDAMTEEEFGQWREDYYLGLMAFTPFGKDENGEWLAPHGMSEHGVPKLRPEDQ